MQFVVVRDERAPDVALDVAGELDMATAEVLRKAVADALGEQPQTLYVDLTGTTFVDSSGCRELLASARHGEAAGCQVEFVVPAQDSHPVRRVLQLLQLDARLTLHDTMPAA